MRTDRFQESCLFRDLTEAIDTEFCYCLCHCLRREARPEIKGERYKSSGYPLPVNKPRCWCPKDSPRKCVGWHADCPKRPILKAGEDFQIIKCSKDHSQNSDQACDRRKCRAYTDVVPDWLKLVCGILDAKYHEPHMHTGLQFEVLHVVAGYHLDDPHETSVFASLICIIIEELRFPSNLLGLSWMPDLHGIIWLEDRSIKETVDLMMRRLIKAKEMREAAESPRRRGSRWRR